MMKIKRNYLNCVKDNSSIVPWSWPPVNAKLVLLAAQHSLHFFFKEKDDSGTHNSYHDRCTCVTWILGWIGMSRRHGELWISCKVGKGIDSAI